MTLFLMMNTTTMSYLTTVHNLQNIVVCTELVRPNVDVAEVGLAQEVLGKPLHLLGPGRGPHAHLSVRTDLEKSLF